VGSIVQQLGLSASQRDGLECDLRQAAATLASIQTDAQIIAARKAVRA
jgi:hypothetical protein